MCIGIEMQRHSEDLIVVKSQRVVVGGDECVPAFGALAVPNGSKLS